MSLLNYHQVATSCMVKNGNHRREKEMISYKRLWVLLAEKELNKKKLMEMTGIGTSSMAKLTKGANVTTDILCRICKALKCDFKDIMEYIGDDDNE